MAGEAPNFLPDEGRLARWTRNVTDTRLALYMVSVAAVIAAVLLFVDARLLR